MNPTIHNSAVLAGFYHGKLVLIEDEDGFRLPRAASEAGEAPRKTLRRVLYEKTGGLLGTCHELDTLVDRGGQETDIFVGEVQYFERPPDERGIYLCELPKAFRLLKDALPDDVQQRLSDAARDVTPSEVHA